MPTDFSWKNPKGIEIGNSFPRFKKTVESKLNQVILTIRDVTMADSGMYKLTVGNFVDPPQTVDLFLTVRGNLVWNNVHYCVLTSNNSNRKYFIDAPEVSILRTNSTNKSYFHIGKLYTFRCRATGFPYPSIEWSFQECSPDLTRCNDYFKPLPVSQEIILMEDIINYR